MIILLLKNSMANWWNSMSFPWPQSFSIFFPVLEPFLKFRDFPGCMGTVLFTFSTAQHHVAMLKHQTVLWKNLCSLQNVHRQRWRICWIKMYAHLSTFCLNTLGSVRLHSIHSSIKSEDTEVLGRLRTAHYDCAMCIAEMLHNTIAQRQFC